MSTIDYIPLLINMHTASDCFGVYYSLSKYVAVKTKTVIFVVSHLSLLYRVKSNLNAAGLRQTLHLATIEKLLNHQNGRCRTISVRFTENAKL